MMNINRLCTILTLRISGKWVQSKVFNFEKNRNDVCVIKSFHFKQSTNRRKFVPHEKSLKLENIRRALAQNDKLELGFTYVVIEDRLRTWRNMNAATEVIWLFRSASVSSAVNAAIPPTGIAVSSFDEISKCLNVFLSSDPFCVSSPSPPTKQSSSSSAIELLTKLSRWIGGIPSLSLCNVSERSCKPGAFNNFCNLPTQLTVFVRAGVSLMVSWWIVTTSRFLSNRRPLDSSSTTSSSKWPRLQWMTNRCGLEPWVVESRLLSTCSGRVEHLHHFHA